MTTLGPTDRSRPAGEPDGDATPTPGAGAGDPADIEPAAIGPMLWGLGVREIHAALWAARGVQCVARGRRTNIVRAADLYLLLEPGQLVDFELQPHLASLFWDNRKVARVRVLDRATPSYREQIIHDEKGWVIRVERRYVARHRSSARVLITADGSLAAAWAAAATRRAGWQMVRDETPWRHVDTRRCDGETAWVGSAEDEHRFLGHIVATWMNPGRSLTGLRHHGDGVWTTVDMSLPPDAVLIGPLWIGVGPPESALDVVVGPEMIEDCGSPELPVVVRPIREIEAVPLDLSPPARSRIAEEQHAGGSPAKRLFDVVFSSIVLLTALPFFALIALAIMIEDGRPAFYAQVREGRGGKKFNCWKFRSMFNGAEARAREYQAANASDGPHVNIVNDPRVTRIGRFIRRVQVDELPQFWNVVRGEMSVVGPRPSPEGENQLCPAWRELRLSVQPGITGLWQIRRTRREGEDFQEWIRYDMEYVERRTFVYDMKICLLTAWMMVRGRKSTAETT